MAQSVKRVVGLKNLGNTCYLNSVLQSLASSSSLRTYLENGRTTQGKQPLTDALHDTLEELNKQCTQAISIEPPRSLLKVGPISTMLNTKEQQDAHELMQLLMNILDEEHSPHVSSGLKSLTRNNPPRPSLRPSPITPYKHNLPTFVNRAKGDLELVKLSAHQENPFYGLMATTKKCTSCGSESLPHYQKFFGISLSIPENRSSADECTLHKCLERFTTQQMVEDVEWVHQRSADTHSPPSPANAQLTNHPSLVAGFSTVEPITITQPPYAHAFDSKHDSYLFNYPKTKPTTLSSARRFTSILGSSPPILGSSPPTISFPKYPIPPASTSPPKILFTPAPTLPTPSLTPPPPTPTTSTSALPSLLVTLPAVSSTIPITKSVPIPIPKTQTHTTHSNPIPIPTKTSKTQAPGKRPTSSGDRACESGRCTALLNLTIARPPMSLCLHLRRLVVASISHPTFVKLDTHIQFPIMLDLASYCGLGIDISSGLSEKPHAPINKLEYRLNAVIVHSGGPYGGHFTVYRRLTAPHDGAALWANISDDYLSFVDEPTVLESEAYMLYYERERELGEPPVDNTSLMANLSTQIKSGLCFGLQHTLNGLNPS